jgi:hypothetical protein
MKSRVQSNISRRILLDGNPTIRQRLPFGLIPSGRRQRLVLSHISNLDFFHCSEPRPRGD